MVVQNINTKTTLDSQIISGNRPVCNMYATVESSGAYNINFNIIDAKGWFDNESSNTEDMKALLDHVQQVAHDQYLSNSALSDIKVE